MKIKNNISIKILAGSLTILLGFGTAFAGNLTNVSDTLSTVKLSATNVGHTITFKVATAINTTAQTIVINFDTGFNFTSKTFSTVTMTSGPTTGAENSQTLAGSAGASAWGAVFSGTQNTVLTLTYPTSAGTVVAANDKVIINFAGSNSVNPSGAGSKIMGVLTSVGDTGSTTINIIANDAVAVTANVPQSLTFSILSSTSTAFGNVAYFGTLSAGATHYASSTATGGDTLNTIAHTLVIGTNAPNGYTITVSGQTLNLGVTPYSATNTIDQNFAAAATTTGTEQFGIYATKAGGVNGTIATPYLGVSGQFGYNASATSTQTFASGSTATANETYSLRYAANMAANTEAGSYSVSLVYVGTANF